MPRVADLVVLSFDTEAHFEAWLEKNHRTAPGVWVRFYKKGSGVVKLEYRGALDVALCFGWIDSQLKRLDEVSYLQKFTPRGPKSVWSKNNREHVARLAKAKRMRPAGLAVVESAKRDGRWERAYDSPKNMTVPPDFLAALAKNRRAKAFFETLSRANRYAIAWRLATAKKPETRARRMQSLLAMLARGERLH